MPLVTRQLAGALLAACALAVLFAWWIETRAPAPRARRRALGGLAVLGPWSMLALFADAFPPRVDLGLGLALLLIVAVGLRDLKRPLGPLTQLLAQIGTALLAVFVGGITAAYVSNPFGGLLFLTSPALFGSVTVGALLTVAWIVLLMNAMNFLDGMDGLATSVGAIGFLTVGAVSLLPQVNEPAVALPAFLAAGATAGFLLWNLPPARLVLGTPGAWFLGFLLAVLSVQGSSKIATLAVVGAIPLFDGISVVVSRVRSGGSPFRGDRTHLHHRLAGRGWSPRAVLSLYATASAILAVGAVLLPTPAKVLLLALTAIAVVFSAWSRRRVPIDAREG